MTEDVVTYMTPLTTIGVVSGGLLPFRLENPGRMQFADVRGVDLLAGEVARLIVVAVRVQEIGAVARCRAQLLLRHRRRRRARYRFGGGVLDFLSAGRAYRGAGDRRRVAARARAVFLVCIASSKSLWHAHGRTRSSSHGEPKRELATVRLPPFLSTRGKLPKICSQTDVCADCPCTAHTSRGGLPHTKNPRCICGKNAPIQVQHQC